MASSQPLAYHLTCHALEARAGLRGLDRLALSVDHVLRGHVSFQRCAHASEVRTRSGASGGEIERSVCEWFETDLNPVVQSARTLTSARDVIAAYNLYQQSAKLAIVTQVRGEGPGALALNATRDVQAGYEDPAASRHANFAILERLAKAVSINSRAGARGRVGRLSDAARFLGVESSAAAEVVIVLEVEGSLRAEALAKRLGCSLRSLQRRLAEEGHTAEKLRLATRLLRATQKLATESTLTEVAVDEGFADLAHMTRSFRQSCGMTPSSLRRILRGHAAP